MTREILFRGKRIDNKEWVEGDLCSNAFKKVKDGSKCCYILDPDKLSYDCFEDIAEQVDEYEVNPKTVGQYTGLKDSTGKRIFEGDIVCYRNVIFRVEWSLKYCAYLVVSKFSGSKDLLTNYDNCEVIGNVHDHPELLEV